MNKNYSVLLEISSANELSNSELTEFVQEAFERHTLAFTSLMRAGADNSISYARLFNHYNLTLTSVETTAPEELAP